MKVLLLCDRESAEYDGLDLRTGVDNALREAGNETTTVMLNGEEIGPCLGCYRCWVKTPGLCAITTDSANAIAGLEVRADTVIFLSRICYGGYSHDIKSFLDRSIPNISPFFSVVKGETRHPMRYDRFPVMISIGYGDYTPQERQTFVAVAERNALNMRPPRHYVYTVRNAAEMDQVALSLKSILAVEEKGGVRPAQESAPTQVEAGAPPGEVTP